MTASLLSAVLWNTECSSDLCDLERINSQVAVLFAVPFNQVYYLYQHADMPFGWKVALQLSNFIASCWIMLVVFAQTTRIYQYILDERLGHQILYQFGVIYLCWAFVVQLEQLLEGLISITISCLAVISRKNASPNTINDEQKEQMRMRLEALQQVRSQI